MLSIVVVGSKVDIAVMSIFVSARRETITLKDIGIVWYGYGDGVTLRYFLLTHDAVNQAINNGEIAVVSYDIRKTVLARLLCACFSKNRRVWAKNVSRLTCVEACSNDMLY